MDSITAEPINPSAARRPQARNKRQALLREARREFAEVGFKGAYIENIATRVGVRKSTFFHYFKDKDALYEEAVVGMLRAVAERVCTVPAVGSFDEQLRGVVDALADALAHDSTAPRLLLRAIVDNRVDCESAFGITPSDQIASRLVEILHGGIESADLPPNDPHELAACVLAFVCIQRYSTCPVRALRRPSVDDNMDALHARLRRLLGAPVSAR